MPTSCGLLMYVRAKDGVRVLLAHPGGPYWRTKDTGAWSIPKGLANDGEDFLDAAKREFREETGIAPREPFQPLAPLRQSSGKRVYCWAFEGEDDLDAFASATFEMEWPRGSGRICTFPEVDRVELFDLAEARLRIVPGQRGFLDQLETLVGL